MSPYYLNCIIVALWIWIGGHAKQYIWMRRSLSFYGVIPHMGVTERIGFRRLRTVEYIPPKKLGINNFMILFRGYWRVWEIEVVSVRRFKTKQEAMASVRGRPIVPKSRMLDSAN